MSEDAQKSQKKGVNVKLILQIAFAVVNLAVAGGGAALVFISTMAWEAPKTTEESIRREIASVQKDDKAEEADAPYVYTMDKFIVNLEGEPKRTIRIEVNLEMLSKDGFEEVMNVENRAQSRDRIVRLLNDQNFSGLEPVQGKLFLKDQIAHEVNQVLKRGIVKDVFFSDFVVQ